MAQAPSLTDISTKQKLHWKNLKAAFENDVAAVELFRSNGPVFKKHFSFLMAFAMLVNRMNPEEIIERANSWENLMRDEDLLPNIHEPFGYDDSDSEDAPPTAVEIMSERMRSFLMQFDSDIGVPARVLRVNFADTVDRVSEEDAPEFKKVFKPLLTHETPFEMMIYLYNNWIFGVNEDTSMPNLVLDVSQETKDFAGRVLDEGALDRLGELAHDSIPQDDEFFNHMTAGLCSICGEALFPVISMRRTLMSQDGEDWDAEEYREHHKKWERKTQEKEKALRRAQDKMGKRAKMFELGTEQRVQLEQEFQILLESVEQDTHLHETSHTDEAKRWIVNHLPTNDHVWTDAEWTHIWSLVGLKENSRTIHRGQFVIGKFLAERYSVFASDLEHGENGFPIQELKLTETLRKQLKRYIKGLVMIDPPR